MRGTGRRELGRKGDRRWKKRGWEIPKMVGSGRSRRNYTTFCNRKCRERREPTKLGQKPGLKGTGSGKIPPPHPTPLQTCATC